jgi:DNA-binding HxlR family transcriptional regulator
VRVRRASPTRRSGCPISIALEVLGDPWSLLVVRDLMFKGVEAFDGFMGAGEGIATNILSDRLKRLEAAGILTKRRTRTDGRRFTYRLTQKGMDLAPAMVELVLWSARHERTDAPTGTIRAMTRTREQFLDGVRAQWAKALSGPASGGAAASSRPTG